MLKERYYRITGSDAGSGHAVFHVALVEDCAVYDGHFPGNPVCPAVCNIEMAGECLAQAMACTLHLSALKKCRLPAVASPRISPRLDITLEWSTTAGGRVAATAVISDSRTVYLKMKAEYTKT